MKLRNIEEVNEFLSLVDQAKGEVYLMSQYGNKFCMKSKLTQYVAMGALLGNHGQDLELWCDNRDDENLFLKFFNEHPETL